MKRTIRLTESDLKHIIKKSVGKILREFGSDGPDWDEPRVYNDFDYSDFYSRMSPTGPSQSANDFDTDEQLLNLDGEDFNDEDLDLDDESLELESKRRMGRILRESIRKVLKEDYDYESIKQIQDSIEKKVSTVIGNRFGFKIGVEAFFVPSYNFMSVKLYIPEEADWGIDFQDTLEYLVSRVLSKYGYSYDFNDYDKGVLTLAFEPDDNASINFDMKAPTSMKGIKSQSPYKTNDDKTNDDGDNINLNDPNSGEAIRRKYAGSNEWGSSSAMENPFSSGSIANLRRMYGGRRW